MKQSSCGCGVAQAKDGEVDCADAGEAGIGSPVLRQHCRSGST